MLQFERYDVVTFDCYGTLIDWEKGLSDAFDPVFARHHVDIPAESALELYGRIESELEGGAYCSYREILKKTLARMGLLLRFEPSEAELDDFAESIKSWPPFPDTHAALKSLQTNYRLALITNCDDDLIAASVKLLGIDFDWIITAQQLRSYKPSHNNFIKAFEKIGLPKERTLHVAQSIYHDIIPAKELEMSVIWVNRRHG